MRIGRLTDCLLVLCDDLGTTDLTQHDRIHVTAWIQIAVRVDHLLINVRTGLLWIRQYLASEKETRFRIQIGAFRRTSRRSVILATYLVYLRHFRRLVHHLVWLCKVHHGLVRHRLLIHRWLVDLRVYHLRVYSRNGVQRR